MTKPEFCYGVGPGKLDWQRTITKADNSTAALMSVAISAVRSGFMPSSLRESEAVP